MSSTLTIRNLTSTPLTLKTIDRNTPLPTTTPTPTIAAPRGSGLFSNWNVTRNFTSLIGGGSNNTSTSPSQPTTVSTDKSHASSDVSLKIDAFTVAKTEMPNFQNSSGQEEQVLRLIFEGGDDSERYSINIRTSNESLDFELLGPKEGKARYTGVWIPASSFLAIYSSANLDCWMRSLSNSTPLSGLSIPGTHNSPTCHKALPSVRCQAVSPSTQLLNGIRFFDVRVQLEKPGDPSSDALVLVHGVFPISLTGPKYFRNLITTICDFLDANPSETLILSVKREGTGSGTDEQLSQLLYTHYVAADPSHWYTEPHVPLLGQARGKIILMRRFALSEALRLSQHEGRGWCLDAQCWADNTACDTHGSVCVQDFYEVLETVNIDKKIELCCAHFERAGEQVCPIPGVTCDAVNPVPPGPLYLNFLSASNFWKVGCWPDRIAARINPSVVDFLCMRHKADRDSGGDGSVGIVVCDWVGKGGDWDLVRCVVGMNARLEMIEQGRG